MKRQNQNRQDKKKCQEKVEGKKSVREKQQERKVRSWSRREIDHGSQSQAEKVKANESESEIERIDTKQKKKNGESPSEIEDGFGYFLRRAKDIWIAD